jgi:hypothetical protein
LLLLRWHSSVLLLLLLLLLLLRRCAGSSAGRLCLATYRDTRLAHLLTRNRLQTAQFLLQSGQPRRTRLPAGIAAGGVSAHFRALVLALALHSERKHIL